MLVALKRDNNRRINRLAAIAATKWIDEYSDKFENYKLLEIDLKYHRILSNDFKQDLGLFRKDLLPTRFRAYIQQSHKLAKKTEEME